MRLISKSPRETKDAGKRLGRKLRAGDTVCLYGDLGSGKTTFVKGVAGSLGIPEREIASASFTIISEHEAKPPLYHIDLYRIDSEADLETTGVYDYIGGDGIAVIEWAEKMPETEVAVRVAINIFPGDEREIVIEGMEEDP
ncbi:MAG: tRNA (adenosine(37)-N6)-threonylcarbamoyltransferase complex ATPase subunit type 1 TsaE [Thermodesulfovibrionales bacterium]|nr:tRNA (adenosine(37)-N6)-threonylcarbamoyltransferase complex ATPase subunit type 1 TsaE [Thermodesulfovibrionales bacterium]